MAEFTYEALSQASDTDLGTTPWITIGQRDVDTFAQITGDSQWIHVDAARAAESRFGTTIVHGFFTLALVAGFLDQLFLLTDVEMSINYGSNRVRFPRAVPTGSRVRGRGRLLDVADLGESLQATVRVAVEVEGAERPGCVVDLLIRVHPVESNESDK